MKSIALVCAVLATGTAFANAAESNSTARTEKTPEEIAARQMRVVERAGGYVDRPGTPRGKIMVFDCQKDFAPSNIAAVTEMLGKDFRKFVMVCAAATDPKGDYAGAMAREQASVGVFIVSDDTTPSLLQAPDDAWIVLNVRKLGRNLLTDRAKEKFLAARYRKQLARAIVLVCGGAGSSFPGNLMDVTKLEDLDVVEEFIPYDKFEVCERYLHNLGLRERQRTLYRHACKEGWAPAPTNDIQKAIWDKIHTPPSKPLKITYDKAAQKPVVK